MEKIIEIFSNKPGIILLLLFLGWILNLSWSYYKEKKLFKKSCDLFDIVVAELDNYRFELVKDFESYKISLNFIDFKEGQKCIVNSKKFKEANINDAFIKINDEIWHRLYKELIPKRPKLFYSKMITNANINSYNELKILFESRNKEKRLRFINNKIFEIAPKLAIDNAEKKELDTKEINLNKNNDLKYIVKNVRLKKELAWEKCQVARFGETLHSIYDYNEYWMSASELKEYFIFLTEMENDNYSASFAENFEDFYQKIKLKYEYKFTEEELKKKSKRNLGLGAEFISLRAFNICTITGYYYPEKIYNNMYLGIKRTKKGFLVF